MTMTFDLSSGDHAVYRRSQLRLIVGDTIDHDGPRPGQRNFEDDELDTLLILEDDNLNRAAALAYETLAGEWSRYAGSYRLGPESEETRQGAAFADRAKTLREMYGFTADAITAEESGGVMVDWSSAYTDWVGKF
jgi:hypothetical protein